MDELIPLPTKDAQHVTGARGPEPGPHQYVGFVLDLLEPLRVDWAVDDRQSILPDVCEPLLQLGD